MSEQNLKWIESTFNFLDTLTKIGGGALFAYYLSPWIENKKIKANAKNEYKKLLQEINDLKTQLKRDIKRLFHTYANLYKASEVGDDKYLEVISCPKKIRLIKLESAFEHSFLELSLRERNDLRSLLETIDISTSKRDKLNSDLSQKNKIDKNEVNSLISIYCSIYWIILKITKDKEYNSKATEVNSTIEEKVLSILNLDKSTESLLNFNDNITANDFIAQ